MLEEETLKLPTKLKFWKTHVEKAQDFLGSNKIYCEQNSLKLGTFYRYKKKFGRVQPQKSKKKVVGFKKVSVTVEKPVSSRPPEWVARFLKEFLN